MTHERVVVTVLSDGEIAAPAADGYPQLVLVPADWEAASIPDDAVILWAYRQVPKSIDELAFAIHALIPGVRVYLSSDDELAVRFDQ